MEIVKLLNKKSPSSWQTFDENIPHPGNSRPDKCLTLSREEMAHLELTEPYVSMKLFFVIMACFRR